MKVIICPECGTEVNLNPAKHKRRDKHCTGCRAVVHEGTHVYRGIKRRQKVRAPTLPVLNPVQLLKAFKTYMDAMAQSPEGVMRYEEALKLEE